MATLARDTTACGRLSAAENAPFPPSRDQHATTHVTRHSTHDSRPATADALRWRRGGSASAGRTAVTSQRSADQSPVSDHPAHVSGKREVCGLRSRIRPRTEPPPLILGEPCTQRFSRLVSGAHNALGLPLKLNLVVIFSSYIVQFLDILKSPVHTSVRHPGGSVQETRASPGSAAGAGLTAGFTSRLSEPPHRGHQKQGVSDG